MCAEQLSHVPELLTGTCNAWLCSPTNVTHCVFDSVFSYSFVLYYTTYRPLILGQALPCNSYDNGLAFFHLVLFVASLTCMYILRRTISASVARFYKPALCNNFSRHPEQTFFVEPTTISICRLPKIYCIAELCK